MDHLPKVHQAQNGYPAVPFLICDAKYPEFSAGYKKFRHFPDHCGYNVTCLDRGDLGQHPIENIIPFLQYWLFFGLLTEIFAGTGIPFRRDDFVREEQDGTLFITTKKLPRYMWYWMAAFYNNPRDKNELHGELVASCLQLSNKTLNAIMDFHITKSKNRWDLNSPTIVVLESLFILGEALSQARRMVNRFGSFPSATKLKWLFPPLKQGLLGGGWCVGEVSILFNECDSSTLLYLSTFDRHLLGKDHKSCDAKNICQANQINYETYKTKHAIDCPIIGCENIGPRMKDIASILQDGHFPVIAVDLSVMPNIVEVLSYRKDSEFHNEFIAISHVWSDGLGNPHDDRLPRCQLVRIQQLVNNLYVSENLIIPFWIDTICVPLDPGLKILAIERMADTYSAADGVLVLDNSLQYTSSKASPVELMMRVRYSLWTTRLWTFQEGRLSRDLWFQFQDEAVSMNYFQNHTIQDNLKIISDTLLQDNISVSGHQYAEALARALSLELKPSVQKSLEQYAILPEQDDPLEEEARLYAIRILEQNSRKALVSRTWKAMLAEVEPQAIPSPADYDLKERMDVVNFGTVRSHAFSSIWMVKGVGDASFVTKGNYRPDQRFIDVCRGFRGRSTSRMEDETIFLSVLLGLDIGKVQEVLVMPWRIKEAFQKVGDFVFTATLSLSEAFMLK